MLNPYSLVRFLIARGFGGIKIPDAPHLQKASLGYFVNVLKTAPVFLEYGSGASTVFAAKYARAVVSIDSDAAFLREVEGKIAAQPSSAKPIALIAADIGLTGPWGRPIFRRRTASRIAKWKDYPQAPWRVLHEAHLEPDLILVDGRFRVACVLTSLLNLKNADCTILLDDYGDSPEYHAVAAFADVVAMADRMAVLRRSATFDANACARALERYSTDWR